MFSTLTFAAGACAIGQIIGMLFIPSMAARMLSYKWEQLNKWWWDQCAKLEDYLMVNPNSFPTPKDEGSLGALGIWYNNAITQGQKGELTREQVFALEKRCDAKLHLREKQISELRSQADLEQDYTLVPSLGMRIVCGVGVATSYILLSLSCSEPKSQAIASLSLAAIALFALGISALCDYKARILPWEMAACVLVIGFAYQLVSFGFQQACYSLLLAGMCGGMLMLATKAFPQMMGMGDVRTIPTLMCLVGTRGVAVFVVALAVSLLVFVAAGALTKRIKSLKDRIAMGPCLFIATVCALALPGLL